MSKDGNQVRRHIIPGRLCAAVVLAMLSLCPGCASWPMHQPYQEKAGEDPRPAWLAHGLTGNELHEHNLTTLCFLGEEGKVSSTLVISRQEPGGSAGLQLWVHQYRDPGRIAHLDQLWRQRLAAPYLKPLQGSFEGRPCWFVLGAMYRLTEGIGVDLGYMASRRVNQPPSAVGQLEFYSQDPQAGFVMPWVVWTAAAGDESFSAAANYLYYMNGRFYNAPRVTRSTTGELQSVEIDPWSPPDPRQILAGYHVKADLNLLPAVSRALNQRLLEWKTKELPVVLHTHGRAQTQDLVVMLESALLDLDSHIKKIKEAQDEAARYLPQPGQAQQAPPQVPQWQVEQTHLFVQRKAIVMACLEVVKKALAQKR